MYSCEAMMDLYQLRTFYTLCLNGNYTTTAEKLLITQSAVSHSIRKLEESINARLIDKYKYKSNRKFALTSEGEILFTHCKKIFQQIEEACEDLKELKSEKIVMKIGAPVEFGSIVLVRQIAEFKKKFNQFNINIEFHNNILPYLLRDEVDIIIDCKLHRHDDLVSIPLFREEYVVICSKNYLKQKKIKRPNDLENCTILSMDEDGKWWDRFNFSLPEKKRTSFNQIMQINHIRGIINGTLSSIGIGLVPKYTVIEELHNKNLIQLFPQIKLSEDRFSIFVKKGKRKLKKNKSIINFLLENSTDFQALFDF